jgi:hypothetical protein
LQHLHLLDRALGDCKEQGDGCFPDFSWCGVPGSGGFRGHQSGRAKPMAMTIPESPPKPSSVLQGS